MPLHPCGRGLGAGMRRFPSVTRFAGEGQEAETDCLPIARTEAPGGAIPGED